MSIRTTRTDIEDKAVEHRGHLNPRGSERKSPNSVVDVKDFRKQPLRRQGYDSRGCGLSDRNHELISFEGFVRDLETVTDALQLERFALIGISQGAAVSIAFAARHPDRVSHQITSAKNAASSIGAIPGFERMVSLVLKNALLAPKLRQQMVGSFQICCLETFDELLKYGL